MTNEQAGARAASLQMSYLLAGAVCATFAVPWAAFAMLAAYLAGANLEWGQCYVAGWIASTLAMCADIRSELGTPAAKERQDRTLAPAPMVIPQSRGGH